jgi:hypothetical protein
VDANFSEEPTASLSKVRDGLKIFLRNVGTAYKQRFSTFLNSRHTAQGAKIVKAHNQFLRRVFIIEKTGNKVMFKSSTAKILIILLRLESVAYRIIWCENAEIYDMVPVYLTS